MERERGMEMRCSGIFPLPDDFTGCCETESGENAVEVAGGGVVCASTGSSCLVVVVAIGE